MIAQSKPCSRCGGCKPLEQFYRASARKDGRSVWCKDCTRENSRRWTEQNREHVNRRNRRYEAENRERVSEWSRAKYQRSRRDPAWRVQRAVKAAMWKALKGQKGTGRWFDLMDYTPEQLQAHIERQFTKGMTWENFGEWHLDHIIPLSSFSLSGPDDPNLARAWALTNLRPLWGAENMSKGAKVLSLL